MPVHRIKQCTRPNASDSTEGQSAPGLPSQQEFQQHLRELPRSAIRMVLEGAMREELDVPDAIPNPLKIGWPQSSFSSLVVRQRRMRFVV